MATIVERNGVRYGQSTVQIPLKLKEEAKRQKISLSATLTRALEHELNGVTNADVNTR